ncbi:unnamed protein product, partial [marine sediment metagenome]
VNITPHSTCLRLEYPTSDVDERVIYVTSSAGAFTTTEVEKIQARAIVVGASMRDEVSLEVIEELAQKKTILTADVQSFIRVNDNGKLVSKEWPEKQIKEDPEQQLKKAGFSLREVKEMEEIDGIVEENIFEKVDDNELNKMIKFLQSQLIKTEERLNETIKVKKGLEEIIEFFKKRKRT